MEETEFVEFRGAAWRADGHGLYERAVYCPRCRERTEPWPPPGGHYYCRRCTWTSAFSPVDMPRVFEELASRSGGHHPA